MSPLWTDNTHRYDSSPIHNTNLKINGNNQQNESKSGEILNNFLYPLQENDITKESKEVFSY